MSKRRHAGLQAQLAAMATRNAERRALRDGAPCSHCETLGPLGKVCATCRDGKHLVPKRA